jgi:hypothetical protein
MNPRREKDIILGDRELTLRATFVAIAGIEKAMGQPIFQAVQTIGSAEASSTQILLCLQEILRSNKVRMTPEEIGEAIIGFGLNKMMIWLGEFILMGIRTSDEPAEGGDNTPEGEATPAT